MSLQINWGNTNDGLIRPGVRTLNTPAAVRLACDKGLSLSTLRQAGVRVPDFWTDPAAVTCGDSHIILARTMLRASGGRGIVVVRPGDQLPHAPLYVKYIRKSAEYRVHVLGGAAAVVQQKRRRTDTEQTADQQLIRNYDNGWVFAVENVQFISNGIREEVERQAVAAVAALGLDFGAVDIIVNRRGTEAFVLEVNTAPGIESPTVLGAYTRYFREVIDGR